MTEVKGVRVFFDQTRNRYMLVVTRRRGDRGWIYEWRGTSWVSYRIARTEDFRLFWRHRHQMFLSLSSIPPNAADQLRNTFQAVKRSGTARQRLALLLPAVLGLSHVDLARRRETDPGGV